MALALAASIWLTGCQTDEDPRSGGFIDGMVGLSTGKYDAFVEGRRDQLQAEEAAAGRLADRAWHLSTQQARLEAEIAKAMTSLDRLDGQLSALRSSLTLTQEQRERLTTAEREASDARQRLTRLSHGDASVAGRQAEVEELQQVIGGIAQVVEGLSS